MVKTRTQPKQDDKIPHQQWVKGEDGDGQDIVTSDNNPKQTLWASWKLFDLNYDDVGDYSPPKNVRLSDFMVARVLKDTYSQKELHDRWPAEFGANGSIRRSRANYGAAAKTWEGNELRYITFGGYSLHGEEAWLRRDTIHDAENTKTWGSGDVAIIQKEEHFTNWEAIPAGARGGPRQPEHAYILPGSTKGRGKVTSEMKGREKGKAKTGEGSTVRTKPKTYTKKALPGSARSTPVHAGWTVVNNAISSVRRSVTSDPNYRKSSSLSTQIPQTELPADDQETLANKTQATITDENARNRSTSPKDATAYRTRTPLPSQSPHRVSPQQGPSMTVPEAIIGLQRLEEGSILHQRELVENERAMVETIDQTKTTVGRIFDEGKTKVMRHLDDQREQMIDNNRVLKATSDSLVSEAARIKNDLDREHPLASLFRRHI
ncbi:MAG: hypothetical protein M1837_007336 [Sclerophora amabilis]|nr:MAG: hypothetical protein M1837_002353 [Sclerophora amabilis]KAI9842267.1 MAG: hypothetical protein M1837_007336 [Sclerophora amabilis]